MHHLDVHLDFVREQKRVRICLSLREDNDLTTFAINCKNVSKSCKPILEGTLDGEMSHFSSSLVFKIHGKINNSDTLLHMVGSDVSYPSGNSCGEEKDLQLLATLLSTCC